MLCEFPVESLAFSTPVALTHPLGSVNTGVCLFKIIIMHHKMLALIHPMAAVSAELGELLLTLLRAVVRGVGGGDGRTHAGPTTSADPAAQRMNAPKPSSQTDANSAMLECTSPVASSTSTWNGCSVVPAHGLWKHDPSVGWNFAPWRVQIKAWPSREKNLSCRKIRRVWHQ